MLSASSGLQGCGSGEEIESFVFPSLLPLHWKPLIPQYKIPRVWGFSMLGACSARAELGQGRWKGLILFYTHEHTHMLANTYVWTHIWAGAGYFGRAAWLQALWGRGWRDTWPQSWIQCLESGIALSLDKQLQNGKATTWDTGDKRLCQSQWHGSCSEAELGKPKHCCCMCSREERGHLGPRFTASRLDSLGLHGEESTWSLRLPKPRVWPVLLPSSYCSHGVWLRTARVPGVALAP